MNRIMSSAHCSAPRDWSTQWNKQIHGRLKKMKQITSHKHLLCNAPKGDWLAPKHWEREQCKWEKSLFCDCDCLLHLFASNKRFTFLKLTGLKHSRLECVLDTYVAYTWLCMARRQTNKSQGGTHLLLRRWGDPFPSANSAAADDIIFHTPISHWHIYATFNQR